MESVRLCPNRGGFDASGVVGIDDELEDVKDGNRIWEAHRVSSQFFQFCKLEKTSFVNGDFVSDEADLRGGSEKSVSEKEVVSNQELQISENVDVTLPVEESLAAGITGDTIKTPDKLPVFVAEQSSADQDLPPSPFYEDLSEGISGKEEDLHIFSPPDTRSSKSKRKKKRSNSKFFSW
ncbi:hypothetical protein U1Q18_041548 [Sarracenia purpurea var. burkii]